MGCFALTSLIKTVIRFEEIYAMYRTFILTPKISKRESPQYSIITNRELLQDISFTFFVIELIAGIWAGSLAIQSDAVNLLIDVIGYILAVFSVEGGGWAATEDFTFGFARLELLGALAAILLNWGLAVAMLGGAVSALKHPSEVDAPIMFATASLGFARTLCMAFVLQERSLSEEDVEMLPVGDEGGGSDQQLANNDSEDEASQNINVSAAIVRTIADLAGAITILISSIILMVKPHWNLVDPICTIVVSFIIFAASFPLMEQYMQILMEAAPADISVDSIKESLQSIPSVKSIDSVKIWTLTQGKNACIVYLTVERTAPNSKSSKESDSDSFSDDITNAVASKSRGTERQHDVVMKSIRRALHSQFRIQESYIELRYT
ncbi:cation efflux protein [Rhizoclosmatium globosum]|uniref:Cation efflux protein n=1 Tax=Rhizoclosmatium globosum TaxID=329046 RepID=A0A1Y2B8T3_9FUNG|nr:hypothetical protein HDU79_003424 [Rhizoclosmatium sp. JEL0117]ORY30930.1 cation efflux protein [Rhizoclosmatium globosum]|eukprot:ORY30930.1 cation efflux protein [Rhizoclosmatium globosum]